MERDWCRTGAATISRNFNPRAPHGARRGALWIFATRRAFQSTRSAWSATDVFRREASAHQISIHALRMERDDVWLGSIELYAVISIHALRMERDGQDVYRPRPLGNFNPRAPHGARRAVRRIWCGSRTPFQSTRSAWSATAERRINMSAEERFQSTRSAWSATVKRMPPCD